MVREKKLHIYGLKRRSLKGRSWILPAAVLFIMPIGASSALITNAGTAILNAGNGSVVVTGGGQTSGCIDWYQGAPPSCPQSPGTTSNFSVQGGSTAPFVSGETGTIEDLNFNTAYPVVDFITIMTPAGMTQFDLKDLRTNLGAAIGSCSQATGDLNPGVTCTPSGSPFQLTNGLIDPGTGTVDTVTISLTIDAYGYIGNSGTNYNAANPYVGIFTTQQAVAGNIDTVLQTLGAGQGVSASWSATLSPSTPTPEPGTLWTLGGALLGCGVALRRRKVSASK